MEPHSTTAMLSFGQRIAMFLIPYVTNRFARYLVSRLPSAEDSVVVTLSGDGHGANRKHVCAKGDHLFITLGVMSKEYGMHFIVDQMRVRVECRWGMVEFDVNQPIAINGTLYKPQVIELAVPIGLSFRQEMEQADTKTAPASVRIDAQITPWSKERGRIRLSTETTIERARWDQNLLVQR